MLICWPVRCGDFCWGDFSLKSRGQISIFITLWNLLTAWPSGFEGVINQLCTRAFLQWEQIPPLMFACAFVSGVPRVMWPSRACTSCVPSVGRRTLLPPLRVNLLQTCFFLCKLRLIISAPQVIEEINCDKVLHVAGAREPVPPCSSPCCLPAANDLSSLCSPQPCPSSRCLLFLLPYPHSFWDWLFCVHFVLDTCLEPTPFPFPFFRTPLMPPGFQQ